MGQSVQIPSEAVIQNILAVYERGLTVDALHRAEEFAPLKSWGGVQPCILAARIAMNAGAPRLSARLSVRAWQSNKNHAGTQAQFGLVLSERRGPLAAWRAMRQWKTEPLASA